MRVWFDVTNPPHVNFYAPLINYLQTKGAVVEVTARQFVETTRLLEQKNITFREFGGHGGIKKSRKIIRLVQRELSLLYNVRGFDFSISSNYEAPLAAWLKRKTSIIFDDNDISPNWLYAKFADYVIVPEFIDKEAMYAMGIRKNKLRSYHGFKEDVYIASYKPDKAFPSRIPIKDFVTVRPENIQASYMDSDVRSIVPELLKKLEKKGVPVIYLPRYKEDMEYSRGLENIYVPDKPLNGLDVCNYSRGVLTGAGTFSREAALMGKPAVSFYAGQKILSVDKQLFKQGRILHSRNVDEIIEYVLDQKSTLPDFNRSKKVQKEVFSLIDSLVS